MWFLCAVLSIALLASLSFAENIQDNFNDNALNQSLWGAFGEAPARYATEANARLEIRADGSLDDSGGVAMKKTLSIGKGFKAKVDYVSSGCIDECLCGLFINNVTTDLNPLADSQFHEFLGIFNGVSSDFGPGRSIGAINMINDTPIQDKYSQTPDSSGTFYLELQRNSFYVSTTGFGPANAFEILTVDSWTDCKAVFISLFCWSGNQVFNGSGTYFDNFEASVPGNAVVIPQTD